MTGLLKDNPNALALYPKCTKKETGILSSEDYDKLIKHCIEQATQWDMLIIFFLCIGARLGEGLDCNGQRLTLINTQLELTNKCNRCLIKTKTQNTNTQRKL